MNLSKFNPIIAECHQGQKKLGVKYGGSYLYENIFYNRMKTMPIIVENEKFNSGLGYNELYNICSITEYPLVLGGDHSIGTSTVLSSVKKYGNNITIIWIDAHADINTIESSPSKNTHGIPMACATGLEKSWLNELIDIKLDFDKIIYVGIRDLDPYEQEIITKYKIKHYSVKDIINFINLTTDFIHISFDVDSLEPTDLDSTGTIAPDGLCYNDVKHIINASLIKNNLVSLDIVEFNPELGNKLKSVETIKKIFL